MVLDIIILSELRQRQISDITYCGILKKKIQINISKTKIDSKDIGNKLILTKGEMGSGQRLGLT